MLPLLDPPLVTGPMPIPDAGPVRDGGARADGGPSEGGAGCSAARRTRGAPGLPLVLSMGLAFLARRRRR